MRNASEGVRPWWRFRTNRQRRSKSHDLPLVVFVVAMATGFVSCHMEKPESPSDWATTRITPASGGAFVQSCLKHPESCVPRCQTYPKHCAALINAHVLHKFKSWKLYPGTETGHANSVTPMHGSYLSIHVNDPAREYVAHVMEQAQSGSLDRVNYPNGSIIVKQNAARPDMETAGGPWVTVMFKLDGYCHASNMQSTTCAGGEWFYYIFRFGGFKEVNGIPAYGKPDAFCIDCHNPVRKADYVWTTFEDIRALMPDVLPAQSASPASKNVALDCGRLPLSTEVPSDVALDPSKSPAAQLMFDCLSWRSFIALNQPNRAPSSSAPWRGLPKQGAEISEPGPRVWETYLSVFETFQPGNPNWTLEDRTWDEDIPLAGVCENQSVGEKVLRMTSKNRASAVLDETNEAFGNQFNILVDQNRQKTMFEVRLNRDEWEFIKVNGYANTDAYDVGGPLDQLSWRATPIQFVDNTTGLTGTGAVEIKAAWRSLCTDAKKCDKVDDPTRYYTRDAFFLERSAELGQDNCIPVTVGLVGMHIAHKTFWSPQWVWSTFEHEDNVPPVDSAPDKERLYSFYNPAVATKEPSIEKCETQRPGIFPLEAPNPVPKITNGYACPNLQSITNSMLGQKSHMKLVPNQVTRIDPISDSPLNKAYPAKLMRANSVFQHYRLINTQWPLRGRHGTDEVNMHPCPNDASNTEQCYAVIPRINQPGHRLRNTTMETYQVSYMNPDADSVSAPPSHNKQYSSAGCIQCHGNAGVDFSFVWTDAIEEAVPLSSFGSMGSDSID